MTLYLLLIIPIIITAGAQCLISARYSKYSKVKNMKGMSGAEIAREILSKYDLDEVYVVEVKGSLTDHYDPGQNVIRLSTKVYRDASIASAAVAAHEVGHAIQYKEGNFFIKLRKIIFPLVNFSSKLGYVAIVVGLLFGILQLIYVGIGMLIAILFFQLVTLPVEFDASRKAMVCLEKYQFLLSDERKGARKVLTAAALTYVAGLVTTLLEILRLILIVVGNRD